jgi:DNA polymerase-3 subunit alpha
VFQVEGAGMRRYLMQMKPKELANVIAMVALFRPGPMEFIPGYIRRMHGEEEVTYRHPLLEPIFKETYGYPVYQEQLMFAVMQLAGYSAPDADDLRKAVAKKIPEKLMKHRAKFVKGAVKNHIQEEVANAIFADWEEFARYGFNKAHAADYGVIAVQTAYLKTHHPVEYMTALLSVNLNDTAKIAIYVADCRRMGIPVEAPDVNISGWGFTIEDHLDGKATIRFGLGAVKNVGHGPVEAILKGRDERPFKDLNDLAHRVDLRAVGKRALECLVKVGAFDSLGSRVAVLDGLDRLIAVSTGHFRAAELGQMSLFGTHSGLAEQIVLPAATSEFSRREILNWEKELLGLYISDHPLNPVMDELTQAVSHFSGQLGDAQPNERVRVAGIIIRIRHHQSKAGKPMGFVTIEDLQGVIELVLFPSTWGRFSNMIEYDRIVLIEGKADLSGAEPKVLVDNVSTDFKMVTPASALSKGDRQKQDLKQPPKAQVGQSGVLSSTASGISPQVRPEDKAINDDYPPSVLLEELPDETPEGPELFPPDWEDGFMVNASLGVIASAIFADAQMDSQADSPLTEAITLSTAPSGSPMMSQAEAIFQSTAEAQLSQPDRPARPPSLPQVLAQPELKVEQDSSLRLMSYLVSPVAQPQSGKMYMVTVVIRATTDKTRDVLRLRRIHGTAMSYPGEDRFAFMVYEKGRGYLVEFPNFSTGVCPELVSRLSLLVGPENVRVEPITFQ